MADLTQLLLDAQAGDPHAREKLLPLIYEELRKIAHNELRRRRPGDTMHTTALVHECYLKLFDQAPPTIQSRTHFLALAARAMRHILVDYYRMLQTEKRGGSKGAVPFEDGAIPIGERGDLLLALDEALTRLSGFNERLGKVVELKFFGGLNQQEIGTMLGLSDRTVRNDWQKAKAWLSNELSP